VAQGVKVAYFVLISCALGSKYTSKWNQMPFAGDSVGTITRLKTPMVDCAVRIRHPGNS